MNPKQTAAPVPAGMGLGDIYYILFRRKWVILLCSLCGFAAAGITFATWKPTYSSTAKLYISDIIETKPPSEQDPDVTVRPTGSSGNALDSELEILNSLDNLKSVAETITPARILADYVKGTNVNVDQAAQLIQKNLTVESPRYTQIILVTFSSRSLNLVQSVLGQVITNYIAAHINIHTPPQDDWATREHDLREDDLKATEQKLAELKSKENINNFQADEAAYKQQQEFFQQQYYMAQAELQESLAMSEQLKKWLPATNQAAATNPASGAAPSMVAPTEAIQRDYRQSKQRLVDLQAKEAELEIHYTTNYMVVQTNLIDIQVATDKLRSLEADNPGLLALTKEESRTAAGTGAAYDPVAAYNHEVANIEGLIAKTNEFAKLLRTFAERGTNLNHQQVLIEDLERVEEMQKDYLKQVASQMNASKLEVALGKNRGANISVIQNPSPPASDARKSDKTVGAIAAGGVVLGFGLAFLWEMVLDRSLRRPREVAEKLKLPIFLNIPYVKNGHGNGNGGSGRLREGRKVKLLPAVPGDPSPPAGGGGESATVENGPLVPRDEMHPLQPFHDTLRDRLVSYFEMMNLTHKPKLVAITSCGDGAGVSTIAAGLAGSLSETGEGNVLLVDMNTGDGVAHHFYKGKLALGLDDILEKEKANRQGALMQENLYVVRESSNQDRLPGALPKRFGHLVTQLKASDYDYILFDMPPVTEISITPRLARFMDTILLVVESQKTDRDAGQRAAELLTEARANVGVVINKSRSYVPHRLHQEF
jgi:Mrp family chromosome partitioning ATPase/uncharacterized protein involved in exopolysaccharide biosynthesis